MWYYTVALKSKLQWNIKREHKMANHEYWVALSSVEGVGPVRIKYLLNRFGEIEAVFDAELFEIARLPLFDQVLASRVLRARFGLVEIRRRIEWLKSQGIYIVCSEDSRYPAQLREFQNAPPVLCYIGELREIPHNRSVAIVGSRSPSDSAILETLNLTTQLVEAGFTIISGLANGIDTTVHLGALSARGRTIAVIGSDLLSIYPADSRQLATKISQNGMVLSEFLPLTPLSPASLFSCDRIISGLSVATIVMESAVNDGSMRTAKFALEQGRFICAYDWQSNGKLKEGTQELIKHGAYPISAECFDVFIQALMRPKADEKFRKVNLDGEQMDLF